MADKTRKLSPEQIAAKASAFLGERVLRIAAPGGRSRGSFRAETASRSLIISVRPELRRNQREALVLERLSPRTDLCPAFIGFEDGILYQEAIAGQRLGEAIRAVEGAAKRALAAKTVRSLFELQEAGQADATLAALPPIGVSDNWLIGVAAGIAELATALALPPAPVDGSALIAAITVKPDRFIRWDGRSGNAIVSPEGRVRWFDFEFAACRHGAEDFAWLIGDETWPVEAATMFELVEENWPVTRDQDRAAFMDYLALYTTMHAIQRLLLITREAKRRGWNATAKIIKRDLVGVRPDMAVRVAQVAQFCAQRHPLTQGFDATLKAAEARFQSLLDQAGVTDQPQS